MLGFFVAGINLFNSKVGTVPLFNEIRFFSFVIIGQGKSRNRHGEFSKIGLRSRDFHHAKK